ncbi:serine-rich adhesin for platelets isoform X2 [Centruroides vittatus]|uniref:serine-rich adhesin for platelets isoform X2 n=1 Tax=Centruroides vittatus TaxID=120091 RepID=UPI00350F5096
MGSCYSRKASEGSYSYSTVSMATIKQEEASRLTRPTPYSRNSSSTGLNFKKKISTKQEIKSYPSPLIYSVNKTGQSNIPRLQSSTLSSSEFEELDSNKSYLDPNSNTENIHIMNNNSILDDSNNKQEINKLTAIQRQTAIEEGNDNFQYDVNKSFVDMTKNSDAVKISVQSKIPSICTAQITGLPRPQVAQISNKVVGKTIDEKKTIDDDDKTKSQKHSTYIPVWQNKYGSSDSSDGIRTDGDSHDSCAAETWDSGIGSSFNEKAKQEDAETLKDVEHFESLESSPISQSKRTLSSEIAKATDNLSELNVSADSNRKNMEDEIGGIKKWNISTPKYKYKGFGLNKTDSDGFSQKLISGVNKNKLKNLSYDNQQTYAAYRNTLSYRKIPVLKQYTTDLTSSAKRIEELRKVISANKDNSNIPRITRRILSEGSYSQNKDKGSSINKQIDNKTASKNTSEVAKDPLSPESDEKSDSSTQGILSPVSELENREFLIDDEIADQPALISFENVKNNSVPSLQQSVNELHVLQAANGIDCQSDTGSFSAKLAKERERVNSEARERVISYSDLGSSSSSLASDDLMMDYDKSIDTVLEECDSVQSTIIKHTTTSETDKQLYRKSYPMVEEKRSHLYRKNSGSLGGNKSVSRAEWRNRSASLPLRPPRPMAVTEIEDGSVKLDASSYRLLRQDLNGMKTMLLKLKRILHEAETLNPFDPNPKNMFYHSLAHIDIPTGCLPNSESVDEHAPSEIAEVMQENTDLRRQLVLLQQQLEERDHTIRLLQQQMTKYTKIPGSEKDDEVCNAATQTERSRLWTNNLSQELSADDASNGTLVSFRIGKF